MIGTWKDIPGFEGIYQADREGNIRRLYQNGKVRILTPYHKKNERKPAVSGETDRKRSEP